MSLAEDTYLTLASEGEGLLRDRGSKFLAFALPAHSPEEVMRRLEELKQLHPKARHHCFAYRMGMDDNNFRAYDDGEPGGTAGKPILGQIDSAGLTNVGVIVVRYFGGTKLGASGLIQAYKESAAAAIANAPSLLRTLEEVYEINFGYDRMGDVMGAIERMGLNIERSDFGESASVVLALRQKGAEAILLELKARIAGISLGEAEGLEELAGVKFRKVAAD